MITNIKDFNINNYFDFNSSDTFHENNFLLDQENKDDFINGLKNHYSSNNLGYIKDKKINDFFTENSEKTICIFDFYKDGKNNTYVFIGNGTDISELLSDYDKNILDTTISNGGSDFSFAFIMIKRNFFCSFIDGFYWYSPIEYYINWKSKKKTGNEMRISPYSYIAEQINNELLKDTDGFDLYIINKEKYASWVFEGIHINGKYPLDIKNDDEALFYKIFYLFEKNKLEYDNNIFFVEYDYNKDEWKNSFAIYI